MRNILKTKTNHHKSAVFSTTRADFQLFNDWPFYVIKLRNMPPAKSGRVQKAFYDALPERFISNVA